jgi:hypothetical protein
VFIPQTRSATNHSADQEEPQLPRLLVAVSFSIDPDLLAKINRDIEGKTQSERLRLCVQEGYKLLKR